MINAVATVLVTASAEQMPRICSVIGLLPTSGVTSARVVSFAIVQPRRCAILRR
jgi:hypothetical protein